MLLEDTITFMVMGLNENNYICKPVWCIIMSEQQRRKAEKVLQFITEVKENTWILPSISDESKSHTVTYNTGVEVTGDYDCDCLGYQYSMNCYHIMAVKLYLQNKKSRELPSDIR